MSHQTQFPFIPPSTVGAALPSPISRRSDPETSKEAAREMNESGRREGQALAVLALVRRWPRSTAPELASFSNGSLDRYQVSRRLADLEHVGKVIKRNSRKCSIRGTEMHTWEAL